MKYPNSGDSVASIEIYNQYGEKSGPFSVGLKNEISLANDGKFVLYGIKESLSEISYLSFYNKEGKLIKNETETFDDRNIGVFSRSGNFFVFLASKDPISLLHQITVKLIIYDNGFNKICEHSFADWSRLSAFQVPIIDEKKEQIKLFRWAGDEEHLSKETIVLNFNCNLLKIDQGWIK